MLILFEEWPLFCCFRAGLAFDPCLGKTVLATLSPVNLRSSSKLEEPCQHLLLYALPDSPQLGGMPGKAYSQLQVH